MTVADSGPRGKRGVDSGDGEVEGVPLTMIYIMYFAAQPGSTTKPNIFSPPLLEHKNPNRQQKKLVIGSKLHGISVGGSAN